MQKKLIVLMVMTVALMFVASCSKKEAPPEDVDKVTAVFFERLTNAEYAKIYSDAASSFKTNNPQSQVFDTLKQMAELGKPGERTRISMTFDTQEGKRTAMPTYQVAFDTRRVTVVFQYIDEEGTWKLGGYEVRQRAG